MRFIFFLTTQQAVSIPVLNIKILYKERKYTEMELKEIHEYYDKVDTLADYEEKCNIPVDERLTTWFGDYGMWTPKQHVTQQMVEQCLKLYKYFNHCLTRKNEKEVDKMDTKELREFYNTVKLLASYEEKYNIPKDERLTIYFSSYNMYVPIKTATKEMLYQRLQCYKNCKTKYETLKLTDSNYSIKYKKGAEYDYKIFRYDKDVTDQLNNNLVCDMLYEILKLKGLC